MEYSQPTKKQPISEQMARATEQIGQLSSPAAEKDVLFNILDLQTHQNASFSEFLTELQSLQVKYESLYDPLYLERAGIVQQIPSFWLTVLKNNPLSSSYVYEHDEILLKSLSELRYERTANSSDFTLHFEFSANEFIANSVLSKTIFMSSADIMERAKGTEITWKRENFTRKVKNRTTRRGKKVRKVSERPSFFGFFKDVTGKEPTDEDEEFEDLADDDYDLACELRDEIIPNALLFYLDVRNEGAGSDSSSAT